MQIHSSPSTKEVPLAALSASMGEQTVVRLVPENLLPAENTALEAIGFTPQHFERVGYVAQRAVGFPAWPIIKDPDNAHHALNLVKDLQWVQRNARSRPADVKRKVDKLAQALDASAPHFVPTFLEEVARHFALTGHEKQAATFFGKARVAERTHNLDIDDDRHSAAIAEFTRLGAVSNKELKAELKRIEPMLSPKDAYKRYLELAVSSSKGGVAPYKAVVKDLIKLAKKAGICKTEVIDSYYSQTLGTPGLSEQVQYNEDDSANHLEWLKKASASTLRKMADKPFPHLTLQQLVELLRTNEAFDELRADQVKFADWFTARIAAGIKAPDSDPTLLCDIASNPHFHGKEIVLKSGSTHVDYVDALLEAGATIIFEKLAKFTGLRPGLAAWGKSHHRDLQYVAANDAARSYIAQDFSSDDIEPYLETPYSREIVDAAMEHWAGMFKHAEEADADYRPREQLVRIRRNVAKSDCAHLNPAAASAILEFDFAGQLQNQLRKGLLAEFAWPEYENVVAQVNSPEGGTYGNRVSFPDALVVDGKKATVVSANSSRSFPLPPNASFLRKFRTVGEDSVVSFYTPDGEKFLWESVGTALLYKTKDDRTFTSSKLPSAYNHQVDGAVVFGTSSYRPGEDPVEEGITTLGTGPRYAKPSEEEPWRNLDTAEEYTDLDFARHLLANDLAGIDLTGFSVSSVPDNFVLNPELSFWRPAVPATAGSPAGVFNGAHFHLVFQPEFNVYKEAWVLTPLGAFHIPGRVDDLELLLAVPGCPAEQPQYWRCQKRQVRDFHTGYYLSSSLTAQGHSHPLWHLHCAGYHNLKVRNMAVSHALRTITREAAQALIDDPWAIVEFAQGDAVLTAAIAGVIVDINQNAPVPLTRKTEELPAELGYYKYHIKPAQAQGAPKEAEKVRPLQFVVFEQLEEISPRTRAFLSKIHGLTPRYGASIQKDRIIGAALRAEKSGEGKELENALRDSRLFAVADRVKAVLVELSAPGVPLAVAEEVAIIIRALISTGLYDTIVKYVSLNHVTAARCLDGEQLSVELDKLLEFKRQQGDDWPGGLSIAEIASDLARNTFVNELTWRYQLAGAIPDKTDEWHVPIEDIKRAGLSAKQAEVGRVMANREEPSHIVVREIVGAAWHEGFFEQGPDLARLKEAANEYLERPWIRLSPEAALALATPLNGVSGQMYVEWTFMEFFHKADHTDISIKLHAAMFVEPGSEEALKLRDWIKQHPPARNRCEAMLGERFDKLCPDCKDYDEQVLSEGYLDLWLDYLANGKPEQAHLDPRVSAPRVVDSAKKQLGLSAEAAVYYVQLLALARPADAEIKQVNGWTKRNLDVAKQELLDAGLVIEANRSGAGRDVFLPGGWMSRSTTGPATEAWKTPHFLVWQDEKMRPVLQRAPMLKPAALHFVEVWERYASGDKPQYAELNTQVYRR